MNILFLYIHTYNKKYMNTLFLYNKNHVYINNDE